MLNKKICLLTFISIFSLISCQETDSTIGPSSSTTEDKLSTSTTGGDKTDELLNILKTMQSDTNYTITIEDDDGIIVQYFNENVWSYSFDNINYTAYIEDEKGIFPLYVDEEDDTVEKDYYELNLYYENIFDIYENITYSVGDITLEDTLYNKSHNRLTLKDVTSIDGISLFSLCGYDPTSTSAGLRLSDVDEMYFEIDEENNVTSNIIFDEETSGRGATTIRFQNIGSTVQPKKIADFLEEDGHGIERVPRDDALFTYLASLKNLRNFTLEVKSDYAEEYNNYEMTSKYMENAYYSHTDRTGESDIGYYQDTDGVRILAIDSLNGDTYIGDLVKDSQGNTFDDLYTDLLFSFADTYWDYSFKATFSDDNKYRIDDYEYISDTANLTAAYVFRFELDYLLFDYDDTKEEYNFDFVFSNNDHIYMTVCDINTTQIGNIPIE